MVRSIRFFLLFIWSLICFNVSIHSIGTTSPSFNKVVIWGHKLHSHTHSYIHYALYKTFKHLGYETYWLDGNDDVPTFDFSNTLFITEGQVDQTIPLRDDCKYILHNCDMKKYQTLFDQNCCIILQVYTHDVLSRNVIKVQDCIYYQPDDKIIYMPWATDLLPHEIEQVKKEVITRQNKKNVIYWIGTTGDGFHGNNHQIALFARACHKSGIHFTKTTGLEADMNKNLIQNSYMAPAIQGQWQCDVGYIPCRIFKNISYGQMGITNSKTVYELFERKIVYNENTFDLFFDAQQHIQNMNQEELFELMDFVKEKHTYINRIETLLHFMRFVNVIK